MHKQTTTKKNITPDIVCTASWRLIRVIPLDGYRLSVEFVDGLKGFVQMHHLINSVNAGIFSALKDVNVFNKVYIEYGAATWPGGIDLSPDTMYEQIKQTGLCVLS